MAEKNCVPHYLEDKPELKITWLASTMPKKQFFKYCSKRNVQAIDLGPVCNEIKNNTDLNLPTSSRLITGVLEIAKTQDDHLLDEINKLTADMKKVTTKPKSTEPVEDFPTIIIDLPRIKDGDLKLIQYSADHIKKITLEEDPICYENITPFNEPIDNSEFGSELPQSMKKLGEANDKESDEFFIEETKRRASSELIRDTSEKRQRINDNTQENDVQLQTTQQENTVVLVVQPPTPNNEPITEEPIIIQNETTQQKKTIVVDERPPTPAQIPRRRQKKIPTIINEFDTINGETLSNTLKNIQLRTLKMENRLVRDVQRTNNSLVNLKRHPSYTWRDDRFIKLSSKLEILYSSNSKISPPKMNQPRNKTKQNIDKTVSNLKSIEPVQNKITSQNNAQSAGKQVFPNGILPNSSPSQESVNNNHQPEDLQVAASSEVNGNGDSSTNRAAPTFRSSKSSNYEMTKMEVEERLNKCKEKNWFPISFYDLFPKEVDSKEDRILGFYYLLDLAGEYNSEWILSQPDKILIIEYRPKDSSFE